MKLIKLSRISIALFGAAILYSSGALAKDANKATLNLSEKVSVEGKTLNPGKYKVEWDGSGPTVQVTLFQGKHTVATFPAHLTEQTTHNAGDAYGSAQQADGSKTLTAIYPGGKRTVLQIDQNATSQQSSNQGSN
jgi:hypothetical protein